MPCYHPLEARQHPAGGPLSFPPAGAPATSYLGWKKLQLPCGQCSGCRLERSREWAARCMHHAKMHQHNSYITLTYNTEHLPRDLSLNYQHWQGFMRRLRKAAFRARMDSPLLLHRGRELTQREMDAERTVAADINQNRPHSLLWRAVRAINSATEPNISFYMAGEYMQKGQPHYHALLFGVDFADRQYLKTTPAGHKLYTSETLTRFWPYGYSSVGNLTFESAAYVARYVMKKRTGDGTPGWNNEKNNYNIIDLDTGEIHSKKKEFNNMSRRNAIGKTWLIKYATDVYTTGKMVVRGHETYPPRYYDKLYAKIDERALEQFKLARAEEAKQHAEHHTPERLAVQEVVENAKTRSLKRNKPWETS